jgi:hypothetical protein
MDARIEARGLQILRDRLVACTPILEHHAEIEPCRRMLRIPGERLAVVLLGFVELACHVMQAAEIDARRDVVGL